MSKRYLSLAIVGLVAAGSLIGTQPLSAKEMDAGKRLENFESFIHRTGRFDINAHIVTHGSAESDLQATLGVASNDTVVAHVDGTYAGQAQKVLFRSNGVVTIVTLNAVDKKLQPGRAIKHATQIALSRLGMFYNAERMLNGLPPEHEKGDIDTWVTTSHVHYEKAEHPGEVALAFDIEIAGKPAGSAVLTLNKTGLIPLRRAQTLKIDDTHSISTTETYSKFSYTP